MHASQKTREIIFSSKSLYVLGRKMAWLEFYQNILVHFVRIKLITYSFLHINSTYFPHKEFIFLKNWNLFPLRMNPSFFIKKPSFSTKKNPLFTKSTHLSPKEVIKTWPFSTKIWYFSIMMWLSSKYFYFSFKGA